MPPRPVGKRRNVTEDKQKTDSVNRATSILERSANGMTLRRKTLLIIGTMLIALIAFLYAISSSVLLRGVGQLERETTRRDVDRAVDALMEQLGGVDASAAHFAESDEMQNLVALSDAGPVRAMLTDAMFKRNRLSLVVVLNSAGRLVYGQGFDPAKGKESSLPESFVKQALGGGALTTYADAATGISGFVLVREGSLLVASRPIIGPGGSGRIIGSVIAGRFLSASEVRRLGQITHLSLTVDRFADVNKNPAFDSVQPSLSGRPPIVVSPLNDDIIAGYTLLKDIYGRSALQMRVDIPRAIYKQGRTGVQFLITSLLAVSVVFGVASLLLLERMVLSRLANLGEELATIGAKGNLSARVRVSGSDELSRLADTINVTLQALEQAQRKVMEFEERYRAVVRQSSEGILLVDPVTKRLLEANMAMQTLLGYGSGELFGLKFSDLFAHDRESIEPCVEQVLADRQQFRGERQVRRRDDSLIDVELSLNLISLGGRQALCAVFRDITERKEAEEALRRAHDDLEVRVQQRTTELKTTNVTLQGEINERQRAEEALLDSNRRLQEVFDELKRTQNQIIQHERLSALGQMASGIAHDFNNTLAPILGFSELLINRPDILNDSKKLNHYLHLINTATRDAASVVSRLREFYRRRREDDVFTPVNLNRLIEQAVSLTQPKWKDQAMASGAAIRVETDLHEVPNIDGNEAELREALTNLIFNAVDALPEGGTITLRSRVDNESVVLEVADTGTGMTEETRQRCLEPFFSTKGERGTGLGLAMVHGIARRHEGTIDIRTQRGKGTTFILRFPVQRANGNGSHKPQDEAPVGPLRILMADDEPLILEIQAEYMKSDGHIVVTAANGREGWDKFRKGRFDLVVLDRAMPEMNGDQLAAAIKGTAPDLPVIMVTGFGDMMKSAGEQPEGVDLVVSKPVTLNSLRQAVAQVFATVATSN